MSLVSYIFDFLPEVTNYVIRSSFRAALNTGGLTSFEHLQKPTAEALVAESERNVF